MKAKKLEYDHQLGDQLGELHKPLYTLLIEQEKLEKIDLFEGQEVRVGANKYTVEGRRVYRNGKELERGKSTRRYLPKNGIDAIGRTSLAISILVEA